MESHECYHQKIIIFISSFSVQSNFFGDKSNWRRLVLCWDEMGEERKDVISAKPAAGPSSQPLLPKTDLQDN